MSLANYNPDVSLLTPNQSAQLHVYSGGAIGDITADEILGAIGFADNKETRDAFVTAYMGTKLPDYDAFLSKIKASVAAGGDIYDGTGDVDTMYNLLSTIKDFKEITDETPIGQTGGRHRRRRGTKKRGSGHQKRHIRSYRRGA